MPGPGFLGGSPGVARPGGEPFSQRGDLLLAEPGLGECPVIDVVELLPGVGEVLAGQARVQPPGEADQLGGAVAVERRGDIGVVAGLDPADQYRDLAANRVLQIPGSGETRPNPVFCAMPTHLVRTASFGPAVTP